MMDKQKMYDYIREELPEIATRVDEQIEWMEEDNSLHVTVGFPFTEFLEKMAKNREWKNSDKDLVKRVFKFFEEMYDADWKVLDVLQTTIMECIVNREDMVGIYWGYMNENLRKEARAVYAQMTDGKTMIAPTGEKPL